MISSSESDDCKIVQDDHRSPVFQDEHDDAENEEDDEDEDPNNSGLHVNDALNVPNAKGEVLVNVGHPDGDRDALLAPQLAAMAKPHQIGGIRFLYDNIIESEERFRGSQGFGCILAHSMGLGKTFQVVAFVDIFLACTGGRKVLCIVPINTIQNWLSEFNYWLPAEGEKTPLANGLSCPIKSRRFPIHLLNDSLKSLQVCRIKILRSNDDVRVKNYDERGPICICRHILMICSFSSKGLQSSKPGKAKGASFSW